MTPPNVKETPRPLALVWVDPDPAAVLPNPDNWRQHPTDQKAAVEAMIFGPSAPGWAGVGLINDRQVADGWAEADARPVWVNGHLRRELGEDHKAEVPALVGQWSPAAEDLILATFDRVGDWGRINKSKAKDLLDIAAADSEAILLLFARLAKDAGLYSEWLEDPEGQDAADRDAAGAVGEDGDPAANVGPPPGVTFVGFGRFNIAANAEETLALDQLLTEYLETRGSLAFFIAREILGEDPD